VALAIEPGASFAERPRSEDLNHALRRLEIQILVLQEASKLPIADTDQGRQEFDAAVQKKRDELAQAFGSRRCCRSAWPSRSDRRSAKCDPARPRNRGKVSRLSFSRVRAVSPKEITDRYNQQYERFAQQRPHRSTLEQAREKIAQQLTEDKIAFTDR